MPSAETPADEHFRTRRVARLRRTKRRIHPLVIVGIVAVALIAALAARSAAQPDDDLERAAARRTILDETANRQAGTTCVGWPVSLTPTVKPGNRNGTVTVWGDRFGFHLRNNTGKVTTVDVVAKGSSLGQIDNVGQRISEGQLRFRMDPGMEFSFTAGCPATVMTFIATDATGKALTADAFTTGEGPADSPLTIAKVERS